MSTALGGAFFLVTPFRAALCSSLGLERDRLVLEPIFHLVTLFEFVLQGVNFVLNDLRGERESKDKKEKLTRTRSSSSDLAAFSAVSSRISSFCFSIFF